MSDQPGCLGSILARSDTRASCSVCSLFEACGVAGEEVRKSLIDTWKLASEIEGMEKAIRKRDGGLVGDIRADEEVQETWSSDGPAVDIEAVQEIADRCTNKRGAKLIIKWHALGVNLQDIRRGYNPFPRSEVFAFLATDKLLELGELSVGQITDALEAGLDWRRGTAGSHASMMVAAYYAASVVERQDNVLRIRRVA